jgi:hypothetical protein
MSVTETLCECVLDGETVERQCVRHGLRPLRKRKLRHRPGRPSALQIQADDVYFLLPSSHVREVNGELRGGLYR